MDFPHGIVVKNLPADARGACSLTPWGWADCLEEAMATHSSILAWTIPLTEERGIFCGVAKSQT